MKRLFLQAGPLAFFVVGCGEAPPGDEQGRGGSCGAPATSIEPQLRPTIIGGAPSTVRWPFLARLELDGEPNCGATLLSSSWLVTAAHCVAGKDVERFDVVLGDVRRSTPDDGEQRVAVGGVVVHDDHNSADGLVSDHDLALVYLVEPATITQFVRSVDLAECNAPTALWLAGWGSTETGELHPDVVRAALVTVAEPGACNDHLMELQAVHQRSDVFCVGADTGSPGACHGDSGGPAVQLTAAGESYLSGVVVAGGPQCEEFTLVANLSSYRDWINSYVAPA